MIIFWLISSEILRQPHLPPPLAQWLELTAGILPLTRAGPTSEPRFLLIGKVSHGLLFRVIDAGHWLEVVCFFFNVFSLQKQKISSENTDKHREERRNTSPLHLVVRFVNSLVYVLNNSNFYLKILWEWVLFLPKQVAFISASAPVEGPGRQTASLQTVIETVGPTSESGPSRRSAFAPSPPGSHSSLQTLRPKPSVPHTQAQALTYPPLSLNPDLLLQIDFKNQTPILLDTRSCYQLLHLIEY